MDFINKYVAPWVLPNEAIPIHCVWVPEKSLDKIAVLIPEGYTLIDTLNFVDYDLEKSTNSIMIRLNDLKSPNYFGIVLKHSGIIEDVERKDDVAVHFLDVADKIIDKVTFNTRIVRPKLELLGFPKEITVTDSTNPKNLICLEILHRGFGTANLRVEVTHSGSDISRIDSIFADVLREMFNRILSSSAADQPEMAGETDIDEELLQKITKQIFAINPEEGLPIELNPEERKMLKEMLKDETKKEIINRIVYSSLRSLLFSALLYYGERHPVEDIRLLEGKITADLKGKIDELNVRVSYYDSLENEYPPLSAKIRVVDQRTSITSEEFDAPINIAWKKDVLDLGERTK